MGSTNPGDVVLDPFFGTGTTGAVAKMLGRDFIGIEREESYRKVAQKRIDNTRRFDREALTVSASTRAAPRVPFGQLVERGMLRPGEELFSMNNRHKAKVRADRAKVREAMLNGEERYLPARDRGPERRFLRDAVDRRWNIGEILLPAMIAVLAVSLLPFAWARGGTFLVAYALMLFGIIDCWLLWRRTKARFTQAFGEEPGKGSAWYVVLRAFQMRGSRIPRPAVSRGDELVRR